MAVCHSQGETFDSLMLVCTCDNHGDGQTFKGEYRYPEMFVDSCEALERCKSPEMREFAVTQALILSTSGRVGAKAR